MEEFKAWGTWVIKVAWPVIVGVIAWDRSVTRNSMRIEQIEGKVDSFNKKLYNSEGDERFITNKVCKGIREDHSKLDRVIIENQNKRIDDLEKHIDDSFDKLIRILTKDKE